MHRNDIPAWADPLLELALTNSRYITVRDNLSKAALERFAGQGQITVMADTGFGISRLLEERGPSAEFNHLRELAGLTAPYVIVQAAAAQAPFWRFVREHAQLLAGLRFLVLPISPTLGEHEALAGADLPGLARLPYWPHPLLLAELISQAAGVVGHSYHLAITALACGVPVFSPVDISAGKYTALAGFETLYILRPETEIDPHWFLARLGKTEPLPAARATLERLARHWDRIAAIIRAGPTATPPAVSRFRQLLPNLLEEAADAAHRLEAECAARQGRIDELSQLLAVTRAEVVARDERIAALYNSPSMRITAPLRALKRGLKKIIGE